MKRQLIVRDAAVNEISNAFEWYELQAAGLGYDFLDEWEKLAKYVKEKPELFRERKKKFRLARFERFPYFIVFIIEQNDSIVVYGVVHAQRKSSKIFKK